MNSRLEEVLLDISSEMTPEEIEKRSRVQKRGRFSDKPKKSTRDKENKEKEDNKKATNQISLFDIGI